MKIFFNHLAKCGGSTINAIAEEEYGKDFHDLNHLTEERELDEWLNKERCFITSEMQQLTPNILFKLLGNQELKRIILTSNPIDRFKSFCGHAARTKNEEEQFVGLEFWGHEEAINRGMSANVDRSCLSRTTHS